MFHCRILRVLSQDEIQATMMGSLSLIIYAGPILFTVINRHLITIRKKFEDLLDKENDIYYMFSSSGKGTKNDTCFLKPREQRQL